MNKYVLALLSLFVVNVPFNWFFNILHPNSKPFGYVGFVCGVLSVLIVIIALRTGREEVGRE